MRLANDQDKARYNSLVNNSPAYKKWLEVSVDYFHRTSSKYTIEEVDQAKQAWDTVLTEHGFVVKHLSLYVI